MVFLPFRALGVFFGSLVLGGLVAWQANVWLGILIMIFGVFASIYVAVRDVIKELKDTVSLAQDPKQIFVSAGIIKSKLPPWLKPIVLFIFNKLLGNKTSKNTSKKTVKSDVSTPAGPPKQLESTPQNNNTPHQTDKTRV